MTDFSGLTLAEINEQIELLEVAQRFGSKLQQFTDWLSTLSGGETVNWVSDDETVQFVLGGLKDAAFEFSETLGGFAENFEPLTDAASTAGNINTAVQAALSIATAIDEADQAVGADKADQLANILTNLSGLSQLLTGLSLNPIIGVFIGLYATALKSAMLSIQVIADQVAIRNEAIDSRGGEIDIEATQAAEAAAADAAAEAQLALTEQLTQLYAARAERIAALQGVQYTVALDFAASRHPAAMGDLIRIATKHGGIPSNAPINGETLGQIEAWVGSATEAEFDLMTEAAAAPVGSEARQQATDRLTDLNEARYQVIQGLGPIRSAVTGALETYGYSTADPEPQASVPQPTGTTGGIAGLSRRAVMIGGGGIFALAMVGLVLFFPGGGGDGIGSDSNGPSSSSDSSSSSSGSSSSGSSSPAVTVAATAAPTACELRREEPLVLEVSSADIPGGVIPEEHLKRGAYGFDFKTPRFQWSAAPPETTDIVILIMKFEDDEFAALQNDPNARGDAIRHGTERWVLTGLDPSLTSLANTSLMVPPPPGAIEQENQGPGVSPNGVPSRTKFVGPAFPERHFMFAVFALCEGGGTDRGSYRGFALGEDAIASGWFFGEPPW